MMLQKRFFIVLAIMMTVSHCLAQTPYFIPSNGNFPAAATIVNSMDVESADVDGDGDLDIIIASEYSRNLLFFNDGNGVFTEDSARLFPEKNTGDPFTGEDSEDIAFADFDQDGDLDILFVSEDTAFHELLLNDGNGGFTFSAYNFPSSAGNAVAILDLNADDFPDVIIGNTGQNNVFINNQDLTFTQENNRWSINTEGTQDLKLIDLDSDGDMDIIEGIDLGSNNVLINTNGFFTEENNRLPATGLTLETRKLTLGDVNGDTFPDIFVSTVNFIGTAHLQNRLYLNDGSGFFSDATSTHLPIYLQHTLDALLLDYDFDSDLDLITTDFQNPSTPYHAFENNGLGVFTETTSTVFQTFTYTNGVGLHRADFNGDTYPDLYFSNFQETDDLLFFSEDALAIPDVLHKTEIVLYPNPVSENSTIQLKINQNFENVSIELHSVLGQKIVSVFKGKLEAGTHNISFQTKNLPSGIYYMLLKSEDGLTTSKALLKQ